MKQLAEAGRATHFGRLADRPRHACGDPRCMDAMLGEGNFGPFARAASGSEIDALPDEGRTGRREKWLKEDSTGARCALAPLGRARRSPCGSLRAACRQPTADPARAAGRAIQAADAMPNVLRIHEAALDALEQIGLSQAPPSGVEILTGAGAIQGDDGRIRFPRALVEDMLAIAARDITLFGARPEARSASFRHQGAFRHGWRGGAYRRCREDATIANSTAQGSATTPRS